MADAAMPRSDSPVLYGKPPASGVNSAGGLSRPASSTSSLAVSPEDGQSHTGGLGTHDSGPMVGGNQGHPGRGSGPRSLITWDSFNSTDFNTLKSAVGLSNVSAAFAWQSPAASLAHGQQHPASGGDAAAAATILSPGVSMPGAACGSDGVLVGTPTHSMRTSQNGAYGGAGPSGSPYGNMLAVGLASAGAGSDGPNTPSPVLLGDVLPPLAAPPGLASALQQRQQQGPQAGVASGGFGGTHGSHGAHGGFPGAQRPLHRYLSEPPRPEELASAGLLDGSGGSGYYGGGVAGTSSGGFLSPEVRAPLGQPALHRHSVGAMPFAAMSLPEGHAMSFLQPPPSSGIQRQEDSLGSGGGGGGSDSSGFSFRSSPQLLGQPAQQQQGPLFSVQPHSPGAYGLAGLSPGSPTTLGLQQQQQQYSQQWQQQRSHLGQQPGAAQAQQQDMAQLQQALSQSQQGPAAGGSRLLLARRTVSFDGGAGASHVVSGRSGMRPGYVHGRGPQQQFDRHQQPRQAAAPGGNALVGVLQQGTGGSMGSADLGRSSSFGEFAPPAPYQPAGLRRHQSTGSSLGAALGAMSQHPLQSSTVGGFGSGSGLPYGNGANGLSGLSSPGASGGSMHGGMHSSSGYGGPASPAFQQGGLHGIGVIGGGDDATAVHRRVRSADWGTPPRRDGRSSRTSTGRNSGGRSGYAGRGMSPGREMGFSGDGGFSHGRGSGSSGHASPQVLSRSTSGAALAARGIGSPTVSDSSGYRQLWAQVTGMQAGDLPPAGEETTVEDLLRVVKQLPPNAEAAPAVARGLYHLDSRALAALLKELAKAGMPPRASEIFDWLRGLPSGHPLASLCDVYTYTTIIAQCGQGQGLRAALELAAEMRTRGIAMNCHAFSALMTVCIKGGELQLALDVFQQLLREGCTPNMVNYNILIDIHSKTGQWEEAVKVLDTLQAQGTAPEVRTYNTVIGACSRAGQPGAAADVYRRMLADGAAPTATTATALVSVFARAGQVDEALAVLQDMVSRGAERSPVAYGALVAAAERGARPALALQLFDDMLRAMLKPSAATFAAALAACAQSGRWERGLEIFELMRARGCKPDAVAFANLLAALAVGAQWQRSLHIFSRMQAAGIRADAAHHNAVLQALWAAGVLQPQARALALVDDAIASGALSPPDGGGSGSAAVLAVAAPGAAAAAALHWLLLGRAFDGRDQRPGQGGHPAAGDARVRGGEAAGAGLRAASLEGLSRLSPDVSLSSLGRLSTDGCSGSTGRALLLLRSESTTAAAAPPADEVAAQLQALLSGLQAPVSVFATKQGVRLEAEAAAVVKWAAGPAAAPAAALAAAARVVGPAEQLVEEDADRETRCRRALRAVQEFELRDCISAEPFALEAAAAARRARLAATEAAAAAVGLPTEIAADAVQIGDRAVCAGVAANGEGLAAAALLVAAPQTGRQLAPEQLAGVVGAASNAVQMAAAAQQLSLGLARCEGGTSAVSAPRIFALLQERLGGGGQDAAAAAWVCGGGADVLAATAGDARLPGYRASDVAAAALYLGRLSCGALPAWGAAAAGLTGHADPESGPLAAVTAVLREAQLAALHRRQAQPNPPVAAQAPLPHTPSATSSLASAEGGGAAADSAAGRMASLWSDDGGASGSATAGHPGPAAAPVSTGDGTGAGSAGSGPTRGARSGELAATADDGGLTPDDVARLQRRLADFGVSD